MGTSRDSQYRDSVNFFNDIVIPEALESAQKAIEMLNSLSTPAFQKEQAKQDLVHYLHLFAKTDFNFVFHIINSINDFYLKKELINSRGPTGWSLLHSAVLYSEHYTEPTAPIIKLFSLEAELDPNITIENKNDKLHTGATPLDLVLILGRFQAPQIYSLTEILLAHGATFSCDLKGDLKDKSTALKQYAAQKENRMFGLKECKAVLSALVNHEKMKEEGTLASFISTMSTPSLDPVVKVTPPKATQTSRKKFNAALEKLKLKMNIKTKLGNAWSRMFQPNPHKKMDKLCDQVKRDIEHLHHIAHYIYQELSPEAKGLIKSINENAATLKQYNQGNKVQPKIKDKIVKIQEEIKKCPLLNEPSQPTPHL